MTASFRTGLGVLGLLALADLSLPLFSDGEVPPMAIALAVAAVGLASLILIGFAARGSRGATVALIVLRALSALAAAPALYEPDVPGPLRVMGGAVIALTIVGIVLVLTPKRVSAR